MKKCDVVVLEKCFIYYEKTEDELKAERDEDADRGRQLNSVGEPRLYCRVGYIWINDPVSIFVTKTRNVSWRAFTKKPRGLVEGIVTSGRNTGMIALFERGTPRLRSAE